VLGRALAGIPREQIVVSSKSRILDQDGKLIASAALRANLGQSLRALRMDRIDVFHLHAVQPRHYDHALSELVPMLLEQKRRGTIGHLGITETPPRDPDQAMLMRAVDDPCWEVVMLAFHMMNQGPRRTVLPRTRALGIGTLLMFVVRNVFSRLAVLQQTMRQPVQDGQVPPSLAEQSEPLSFLIHEQGASSVTDAAYRFARHEPGVDVVLFGTGNPEHLRSNIASLLKPPLPPADVEQLQRLFGHLRGVGLVFPDRISTGNPFASV